MIFNLDYLDLYLIFIFFTHLFSINIIYILTYKQRFREAVILILSETKNIREFGYFFKFIFVVELSLFLIFGFFRIYYTK